MTDWRQLDSCGFGYDFVLGNCGLTPFAGRISGRGSGIPTPEVSGQPDVIPETVRGLAQAAELGETLEEQGGNDD